jgi:hypothetical protein
LKLFTANKLTVKPLFTGSLLRASLVNVLGIDILMVDCRTASGPCFLDGNEFYVRTNPATDKLDGPKLVEYVRNHFKI